MYYIFIYLCIEIVFYTFNQVFNVIIESTTIVYKE